MSSTTEGLMADQVESSSSKSAVTIMDSLVTNIVESMKVAISSTTTTTSTTDSIASNPTSTSLNAASAAATSSHYTTISSKSSTEHAAETTSLHPEMMNVAELSQSLQHFGLVDYLVFVLMLIICAVIGFYFGFIEKRKKKRNVDVRRGSEALDYLVGGRKMKVFPVALSLVASFVSGISLLGTSTEIYVYGTQYAFILVTLAISGVISWYVFLPVFCNLQLTSTYEYFELRFDKGIRLFGSVLFTVGTIFWLPIVIYVPALAFNQVTGVNIHIVTPAVCIVCIFYTCVGGLKAVVWTDVIQTIIMFGAIVIIIIKGTINIGGFAVVWQRNADSGRLEVPEWTWDPTVRVSMFSMFFGTTLYYLQLCGGNQVITQRYLSLPDLKAVKKALILFIIGMTILHCVCFYNGLLIFARYYDCDPLTTKLVKAKDQLVPLMAMEILNVFPGMPGLFIAGAALSSLSTGLNSLAAVFLEDFIKPFKKIPLTESQTAIVMRLSVLLIGVLCVILVFVVEHMGSVLQLSMTLNSITNGPLFGLFMMGLTLPWINGKSALTGSIISFIIMLWISVKAQLAMANGEIIYAEKAVSTAGCTYAFEALTSPANSTLLYESSKSFSQYIYHMSFMFYVPVGATLTILGAFLASLKFGYNDPSKMNINVFPPFVQRFLKPVDYESVRPDEKTVIFGLEVKDTLKE